MPQPADRRKRNRHFLHRTQHLSEQAPIPCPILQEKQANNLPIHPKPEEKPCHTTISAPHSQQPQSPASPHSSPATPQRQTATTTPCSTSASATTTRASIEQALPCFTQVAQTGNDQAETYLGIMYQHGFGTQTDLATAAKWYKLAARQGDAWARSNLAAIAQPQTGHGQRLRPIPTGARYRTVAERTRSPDGHGHHALLRTGRRPARLRQGTHPL